MENSHKFLNAPVSKEEVVSRQGEEVIFNNDDDSLGEGGRLPSNYLKSLFLTKATKRGQQNILVIARIANDLET